MKNSSNMKPNLNYLDEIYKNDIVFKKKLITIIKREFPLEKNEFTSNYNNKKYILAALNVHKLKHKINVLGLKEGFKIASEFEKELNNKKFNSYNDFIVILNVIENYLKEI